MAGRHPRVPACSPKKCIISHSYHSVLLEFCVHVKSTVEFFYAQATFTHALPDRNASEDKHVESDIEHLPTLPFFPCFKTLLFCRLSLKLQNSHTLSWEVVMHFCFIDDLASFLHSLQFQLQPGNSQNDSKDVWAAYRSWSKPVTCSLFCCCCLRTTVQTQWRTRRYNKPN